MPKNLNNLLLLVLLLLGQISVKGQIITGSITDFETKKPLPYVHIGVKNTSKGTIAEDDGSFSIDLTGLDDQNTLHFSFLGYEDYELIIKHIGKFPLVVQLKPLPFTLSEVVVTDKKKAYRNIKLGNYKNSSTTMGKSGDDEFGWGGEWGIIIPKHTKPYQLKDIQFHLRWNTVDSVLFRVNVHQVDHNLPVKSKLRTPAFVTARPNEKWISLDLLDRNLMIEEDIAVTFEWVRIWYADEGKNLLFFSHAKRNTYDVVHTERSFSGWKLNRRPPPAIYVNGLVEKER
ncbi:MAG: carboxypeptidase-like regulatory domain-containing protein [Bacteroidota bacterium]